MAKPGPIFRPGERRQGEPVAERRQGSKRGRLVAAFLDEPAFKQLGILSVETGRTKQDLLIEAVNDLFLKYGKMPIG